MLTDERRDLILERLRADGKVVAAELGASLDRARAGAVEKRLILLGGAPRSKAIWQQVSTFAGGPQARALALPWASGDPEGALVITRRELEGIRPESFLEMAPSAPMDAAAKQKLLDRLAKADAILIMGGDQNKLLDVLNDHPDVVSAIKARYEAGVVVVTADDDPLIAPISDDALRAEAEADRHGAEKGVVF